MGNYFIFTLKIRTGAISQRDCPRVSSFLPAKIVHIFGLCKKIIFFEASLLFEPISCGIGIFILTLYPEIRK